MLRARGKNGGLPPQTNGGGSVGGVRVGGGVGGGRGSEGENKWELRPGGMLVQKRIDEGENRVPPPTIRVRIKYGSIYHEIHISSQASFGELKKMLSGPTGLHHLDQKLFYKDKERDSAAFLDTVGVKDKSKIVMEEDPISQEKRYLEMKKNAKMEKSAKLISDISLEVDRLAGQVYALETVISKGGKVCEKDVTNRIDSFMNQLVKLEGIAADGDVKLQRKMQAKRIQKYVETLDRLKIKISAPATGNGHHSPLQQSTTPKQEHQQQRYSNGHVSSPVRLHRDSNSSSASSLFEQEQARHSFVESPMQQHQPPRRSASGAAVVITTEWETFDSAPPPLLPGTPPSTSAATARPLQPVFTWDLL